jgi:hypothetical protein
MKREGISTMSTDDELHAKGYYRDHRGSVMPFTYMTDEDRRKRTFTHPPSREETDRLLELLNGGKDAVIEGRMEEVLRYVTGIDAMEGENDDDTETGAVDRDSRMVPGRGDGVGSGSHRGDAGIASEEGERGSELPVRLAKPAVDYDSGDATKSVIAHKKYPTRRELEQAMNRFRSAINDPGLELDHYPASGGYRIVTEDQRTPFGSRRRKASEMLFALDFAVDAIHYRLRGGPKKNWVNPDDFDDEG